MFLKKLSSYLLIVVLAYGQHGKAFMLYNNNEEDINELSKTVSKLGDKIAKLEHGIEHRDRILKTIMDGFADFKTIIAKSLTPMVAFSSHTPTSNIYNKGDTYVFGNVVLNKGNGYNRYNGKFTAPKSGLYQFFLHVCNLNGRNVASAIVHDGNYVAYSVQVSPEGSCSTVTALRLVKKGQQIYVKCTYPTWFRKDTYKYRRSTFSGVLLRSN